MTSALYESTNINEPYPRPSNPYLKAPLLHIGGITQAVTDNQLADAFADCLKIRLTIKREGKDYEPATGTVEFQEQDKAEKAYATVQKYTFPAQSCSLTLSITPHPSGDPIPATNSRPLWVKQLPQETSASFLYSLFRPYGPIYRATLQYAAPASGAPNAEPEFKGQGFVEFYELAHAKAAMNDLHCAEVGDATIVVQEYDASRAGKGVQKSLQGSRWAEAAPFVPGGGGAGAGGAGGGGAGQLGVGYPNSGGFIQPPAPPHLSAGGWGGAPGRSFSGASSASGYSAPPSPTVSSSILSQQQQAQQRAEYESRGKAPPPIDPCNLFIKNLSPFITSQDLYQHFAPYGQIVSARVMKDERTGVSREFGFVSFEKDFQAADALKSMDGKKLASFSEPGDQGRNIVVRLHEPKRYREPRLKEIHTRYPGATTQPSPPQPVAQQSLTAAGIGLGATTPPSPSGGATTPAPAPASTPAPAPATGTSTPSVVTGRTENYVADQARRQQIGNGDLETMMNNLNTESPQNSPGLGGPSQESSPARSVSAALSPSANAFNIPPASASVAANGSSMSERDRLMSAVARIMPGNASELTEMLMSLTKRERALCLFNKDVLRTKVLEAKEILDIPEEPNSPSLVQPIKRNSAPNTSLPTTPAKETTPKEPAPTNGASTTPTTALTAPPAANSTGKKYTMDTLAALPAEEIYRLVQAADSSLPSTMLRTPDPEQVEKAEKLINALPQNKSHLRKQKVGDAIFRLLKAEAQMRNSTKAVVRLVDVEDLTSLGRLTYEYPSIVVKKAQQAALQVVSSAKSTVY